MLKNCAVALAMVLTQVRPASSATQYLPDAGIKFALQRMEVIIDALVDPADKTRVLAPFELKQNAATATCTSMSVVMARLRVVEILLKYNLSSSTPAVGEVHRDVVKLRNDLEETAEGFCAFKRVDRLEPGVPSSELLARLVRVRDRLRWDAKQTLSAVTGGQPSMPGYTNYARLTLIAARERMVDAAGKRVVGSPEVQSALKICYQFGHARTASQMIHHAQSYVYEKRPANAQCDAAINETMLTVSRIADGFCMANEVSIDVKPGMITADMLKNTDAAIAKLKVLETICPTE